MVHFNNDWDEVLAGEFDQEYYKRIRYFLKQEYAEQTVYGRTPVRPSWMRCPRWLLMKIWSR